MQTANRRRVRLSREFAFSPTTTPSATLESRVLMSAEIGHVQISLLSTDSAPRPDAESALTDRHSSSPLVHAEVNPRYFLNLGSQFKNHFINRSRKTELAVENDLKFPIRLVVSDVKNNDWSGNSRPDKNLNEVVIPTGTTITRREEINFFSSAPTFTLTVLNAKTERKIAESSVANIDNTAIALPVPTQIKGWRLFTKAQTDAGRFPNQAGQPVYFFSPGTFYHQSAVITPTGQQRSSGIAGYYHNKLVLGTEPPAAFNAIIRPTGSVQRLSDISL